MRERVEGLVHSLRQSVEDCCGGAKSRRVARTQGPEPREQGPPRAGARRQRCTTGESGASAPGCPRPNPQLRPFLPQWGEQKQRYQGGLPGPDGSLGAGSGSRRAGRRPVPGRRIAPPGQGPGTPLLTQGPHYPEGLQAPQTRHRFAPPLADLPEPSRGLGTGERSAQRHQVSEFALLGSGRRRGSAAALSAGQPRAPPPQPRRSGLRGGASGGQGPSTHAPAGQSPPRLSLASPPPGTRFQFPAPPYPSSPGQQPPPLPEANPTPNAVPP